MWFFDRFLKKKDSKASKIVNVKVKKQFIDYAKPVFFLFLFGYVIINLIQGLAFKDELVSGWSYFDPSLDRMKADEIDKNTPTVGFIKLTGIIQSQKARTPVFVRKNDVITPKLVRDEIHRYMKNEEGGS
jgi:hypothetical protein